MLQFKNACVIVNKLSFLVGLTWSWAPASLRFWGHLASVIHSDSEILFHQPSSQGIPSFQLKRISSLFSTNTSAIFSVLFEQKKTFKFSTHQKYGVDNRANFPIKKTIFQKFHFEAKRSFCEKIYKKKLKFHKPEMHLMKKTSFL